MIREVIRLTAEFLDQDCPFSDCGSEIRILNVFEGDETNYSFSAFTSRGQMTDKTEQRGITQISKRLYICINIRKICMKIMRNRNCVEKRNQWDGRKRTDKEALCNAHEKCIPSSFYLS